MSKQISVEYIKQSHEEEFLEYGSLYTTGMKVPQDNVEEIEKALVTLGFNIWEIKEDTGISGTRIKASPLLIKWEQRRQEERDEHNAAMLKAVEEFNAHEKIFAVWEIGGYTVKVEKSSDNPVEYKPAYSSRIHSSVSVHIYDPEGKPVEINLSNYVTSSGSIQRKKFSEHYPDFSAEIAERLLKQTSEFYEERNKVRNRYNLRY